MYFHALLFSILQFFRSTAARGCPDKIYGVNLGSWLLLEPWMLPNEWVSMGGQICDDCSQCIESEFALATAFPEDVDERFAKHWSTWFAKGDVDRLHGAGINTVRLPLGYWIVEDLVDRTTEHYPRGGIKYLVKGLEWLRQVNIQVILDHHALPGVAAINNAFAGNCTDNPQFYTDYNYGRALTWTAFMTYLSHCHPSFGSVFSIQAMNEPIRNATQTPGLDEFYKNFAKTVRLVEWFLEKKLPVFQALKVAPRITDIHEIIVEASTMDWPGPLPRPVIEAFINAFPMLCDAAEDINWRIDSCPCHEILPLTINFMDFLWQPNSTSNPADAANVVNGPHTFDSHSYYNFGGFDPNPDAYMRALCNSNNTEKDALLGNSPVWVGEWSIATQFNATDEFLNKWADAQKFKYSQSRGWLFWGFKAEDTGPSARQWSYFGALDRGYFTQDPSQYHDPNVCESYMSNFTNPR